MSKINSSIKFLQTRRVPKTFLYTGDSDLDTKIIHYRYTNHSFEALDDINDPHDDFNDMVVVEGFKNREAILKLTNRFHVDEFFIEDIFNVSQRNKYEVTNDQVFIVLKYAFIENGVLDFRRIYFVLKKGHILLFTDYENNYVNELLDRINNKTALFPSYDESYIVYAIYDMIIDEQLEMTRVYKQELEELETVIMQSSKTMSHDLYSLYKRFVQLRNNVQSLIDYVSPKEIIQNELFHQNLLPFISDLEDHIYNLQEKLRTNIDVCNSLISLYSTHISNRTNDVMKTLTIISVIFIPLSFLAGVFGMNFVRFDILQSDYGLLIFFVLSFVIAVGMLGWFKYRKWL